MRVDLVGAVLVDEAMVDVAGRGTAAVFISSTAAHGAPPDAAVTAIVDDPLADDFLDRLGGRDRRRLRLESRLPPRQMGREPAVSPSGGRLGRAGARIGSISPALLATPMGALEFRNQPTKWELPGRTPWAARGPCSRSPTPWGS
jgi:hypothetical protein